jgi:hypothetical protein
VCFCVCVTAGASFLIEEKAERAREKAIRRKRRALHVHLLIRAREKAIRRKRRALHVHLLMLTAVKSTGEDSPLC